MGGGNRGRAGNGVRGQPRRCQRSGRRRPGGRRRRGRGSMASSCRPRRRARTALSRRGHSLPTWLPGADEPAQRGTSSLSPTLSLSHPALSPARSAFPPSFLPFLPFSLPRLAPAAPRPASCGSFVPPSIFLPFAPLHFPPVAPSPPAQSQETRRVRETERERAQESENERAARCGVGPFSRHSRAVLWCES